MSQQQKKEEEKEIEFLKSRKRIELVEQAVSDKRAEMIRQQQITQNKTDREYLSKYLYDKGEDFLDIAEAQFPIQTRRIVHQIDKPCIPPSTRLLNVLISLYAGKAP